MKKRDEILGIMLPDQDNTYLLPNVSIAEIFTLDRENLISKPSSDTADLKQTKILWRQTEITLFHLNEYLSKEHMIDDLLSIEKPRVAVINPITQPGLPLYAILATNTPRLTRLKSVDLLEYEEFPSSDAISFKVIFHHDELHIPNLMHLESLTRYAH